MSLAEELIDQYLEAGEVSIMEASVIGTMTRIFSSRMKSSGFIGFKVKTKQGPTWADTSAVFSRKAYDLTSVPSKIILNGEYFSLDNLESELMSDYNKGSKDSISVKDVSVSGIAKGTTLKATWFWD